MIEELIGKEVEVIALDIVSRGVLVEVNDKEVHLQSERGWIVIPMDRVMDIKEKIKESW
jgi:hypothetical protein